MTAFILVAGAHTGSWIWQTVADRLRESGARAYAVTLTGMGDRGHAAEADTDLETHIHDLLRVIDRTDAAEVVLVGHCYGIYPVLGAADRRPERIARIVHLDAGLPQDGDQALTLVPDPAVRDRLLHRAGPADDDWRIPPPPLEEWQRWGSVAGLSPAVLARLGQTHRRRTAAGGHAHPAAPPVESGLRGAEDRRPVHRQRFEHRHGRGPGGSGDPRFQVLTDPRASFFEPSTLGTADALPPTRWPRH